MLPQKIYPILPVGWTLVHEALFYILCSLVIIGRLNFKLPEILGTLSIVAIILAVLKIQILYGYLFSGFYIEFFFGALAYKISNRFTAYPKVTILLGIVLFCIANIITNLNLFPSYALLRSQLLGGVYGFFLITGFIAADKRYLFTTTIIGELFIRIGNASYTLYLAHWFVLSGMGKAIRFFPNISIFLLIFGEY